MRGARVGARGVVGAAARTTQRSAAMLTTGRREHGARSSDSCSRSVLARRGGSLALASEGDQGGLVVGGHADGCGPRHQVCVRGRRAVAARVAAAAGRGGAHRNRADARVRSARPSGPSAVARLPGAIAAAVARSRPGPRRPRRRRRRGAGASRGRAAAWRGNDRAIGAAVGSPASTRRIAARRRTRREHRFESVTHAVSGAPSATIARTGALFMS